MNFDKYKNVLVLAVGGGNDSVSTLLLQLQLNKQFNYQPDNIDIVAVLPDCLDYHNLTNTEHELVSIINPNSSRSVVGKEINAFPEKILSQNKDIIKELNINNILGISMLKGSYGILSALQYLVFKNEYDLILAIDVGGDFIACKENIEVLSPMIDGYMLFALKSLKEHICNLNTDFIFSVFGLGTDGESTPFMLNKALSNLNYVEEHSFNNNDILEFTKFYRDIVEKNRYSRTTDYTLLEIEGKEHPNPSPFRGRFHVKIDNDNSNKYYGNFEHEQSPNYYGKFYLFDSIDNVHNNYSKGANNGIEWFINVQNQKDKIDHELNGQSYQNIGNILNESKLENVSLFFGTPSRKFDKTLQSTIVSDIFKSINNEIYDLAIIYKENESMIPENILSCSINKDLVLIGLNKEILELFKLNI